jgi:hypothetical protein
VLAGGREKKGAAAALRREKKDIAARVGCRSEYIEPGGM